MVRRVGRDGIPEIPLDRQIQPEQVKSVYRSLNLPEVRIPRVPDTTQEAFANVNQNILRGFQEQMEQLRATSSVGNSLTQSQIQLEKSRYNNAQVAANQFNKELSNLVGTIATGFKIYQHSRQLKNKEAQARIQTGILQQTNEMLLGMNDLIEFPERDQQRREHMPSQPLKGTKTLLEKLNI